MIIQKIPLKISKRANVILVVMIICAITVVSWCMRGFPFVLLFISLLEAGSLNAYLFLFLSDVLPAILSVALLFSLICLLKARKRHTKLCLLLLALCVLIFPAWLTLFRSSYSYRNIKKNGADAFVYRSNDISHWGFCEILIGDGKPGVYKKLGSPNDFWGDKLPDQDADEAEIWYYDNERGAYDFWRFKIEFNGNIVKNKEVEFINYPRITKFNR